ncbi:MAG: uracil-DNA glycosylase [Hyphomicrobiaceae bacterium]|nr:uracil-DNA glycosylase [Hyphomicrobiaceae bacterium]
MTADGQCGDAIALGEPPSNCDRCPRLSQFLTVQRSREPRWHNAPVPSFGRTDAGLLIVGLAPGLNGANRTGRPFTGDHAGDLLYATLIRHGLATGTYRADPGDGLVLCDCIISNAVRCVPPANKPTTTEIKTCNEFLANKIANLGKLRVIVALGRIAHDATLSALGVRKAAHPFAHGARHSLESGNHPGGLALFDSYHCSRYNTNTGVLTPQMFDAVFAAATAELKLPS